MRFLLILILILTSASAFAVDQTWNYRNDFTRRITSYGLSAASLNFNAEVVDYSQSSIDKKQGLDQFRAVITRKNLLSQFQAEIQGVRNQDTPESPSLFSYFRHRYTLFDSDRVTISFQSQLLTQKDDTRSAFGIPLDYRINAKHSTGISLLVEQGRYQSNAPFQKKEMINLYYNYKFFQGLSLNTSLYGEKLGPAQSALTYTQINGGIQYQPRDSLKITLGSYAALNSGPVSWNHTLGATIFF